MKTPWSVLECLRLNRENSAKPGSRNGSPSVALAVSESTCKVAWRDFRRDESR